MPAITKASPREMTARAAGARVQSAIIAEYIHLNDCPRDGAS
jgi:hypothetical protein